MEMEGIFETFRFEQAIGGGGRDVRFVESRQEVSIAVTISFALICRRAAPHRFVWNDLGRRFARVTVAAGPFEMDFCAPTTWTGRVPGWADGACSSKPIRFG
ncbi:hypothetical protein NL676_010520 [Syzygium grande]|nr:hypothetical protein NL676_010520 [Syzygium grande]